MHFSQGFTISVFNRSYEKTEMAVVRAKKEGQAVQQRAKAHSVPCLLQRCLCGLLTEAFPVGLDSRLHGYKDLKEFVLSLKKPRY